MKMILARVALALTLVTGALGVSGCSGTIEKFEKVYTVITSAKATSQAIVLGIQSFDVAKIGATGWLRLRRCDGTNGRPICRDPALLDEVDAAIQEGTKLRNELKAWVRAHPDGIGPQDAYDKLVAATATIEKVVAIYNAAKKG